MAEEQDNLAALDELLKEVGDLGEDGDGKMPNIMEILKQVEESELDEETKEQFKAMLGGGMPKLFGSYGGGTYLGITFVVLIFTILLFFGYKLYKSIKDKELKREEKKKQKQMKKKK